MNAQLNRNLNPRPSLIAGKGGGASRFWACLWLCVSAIVAVRAAELPPADKLLGPSTLLLVTAPDAAKLTALWTNSSQARLWRDPAMKPFVDKFTAKFQEELVKPLERELNLDFRQYAGMARGQITLAMILDSAKADGPLEEGGMVVLIDTKDKSSQLKTNLAQLKTRWTEAGRQLRTEKIREYEFQVVSLPTNAMPKALSGFLPQRMEYHELGEEEARKPATKSELVVGQAGTALVVATSFKTAEQAVARLGGGSLPLLAEQAGYSALHSRMFREAPLYGWVNTQVLVDLMVKQLSRKKENPDAPSPVEMFKPDKLLAATGLTGLRSLGFALRDSGDGLHSELFLNVPESARTGLFKLLAGEPKETSPPPFVPADVANFKRLRIDGQKAWATLEKMAAAISPEAMNGINFLLDTANLAAKEKDPAFDIRKNLIGNLGDDIIAYEKPAKGGSETNVQSSLTLISSPRPEQLSASLKNVLVFLTAQAGAPTEREFLGRKIYSVPLPTLPMQLRPPQRDAAPQNLYYAPGATYLALSTDAGLVEEFLRSSDSGAKPLRETSGLTEAVQRVGGPGTWMFSYMNQTQQVRETLENLRKGQSEMGAAAWLGLFTAMPGFSKPERSVSEWMDSSLLPAFERIAKYFTYSVSGMSANADGISYKTFYPLPAAAKTLPATR